MRLFKLAKNKCPKRYRPFCFGLLKRHDLHIMLLSRISRGGPHGIWLLHFTCTACGASVDKHGVTDAQLMRFGFNPKMLERATRGFSSWYAPPPYKHPLPVEGLSADDPKDLPNVGGLGVEEVGNVKG